MADFIITGPDGKRYRVSGPDRAGAVKALHEKLKTGSATPMKGIGQTIWENIVGDDDPTTQNYGELAGSLLNMAGETMTLGLIGDEASGAAAGLGAAIVPGGADFGEAYARRRDFERDQQAIAEEDAPIASTVAKVGGAILPAMYMKNPQTVMSAAGLGARAGGILGFMEGEGGLQNRLIDGATGAVLGGVFGAASIPLGKVVGAATGKIGDLYRAFVNNRRMFSGGQLTEQGKAAIKALGLNPDDVGEAFQREFQRSLRKGLEPQQAANVANMTEFGIPAYRANVTGLADDFATLERARRGALGPTLEAQVSSAMNAQDAAMREAGEGIATRMAGGVRVDAGDAAEAAMTSTRAARDSAKSAASQAYDDLAKIGAGVQGAQVQNLGTRLANAVAMSDDPIRISPTNTPNAASAATYLDDLFKRAEKGSVPFMELERARQFLVRAKSAANRSSVGADQMATQKMIEAFDEQIDTLMTGALTEGNEAVLAKAKDARALWSAYRKQFTGDGAASKFLQRMIDEDASPDQVVNWLFGAGKLGTGPFNATVAKGVREAVDDSTWNMIRSAAFRKLVEKPEGMTQMGPQAMAQRIGDFFTNPATRDLSRTLFTPEEIKLVMRYQSALNRMVPPPGAVNTSGTAYENTRMLRQIGSQIMSLIGGATGGVPGYMASQGAQAAVQRGSNWIVGRSILRVKPPASAGAAPRIAGALAGNVAGPAADTATNLLGQFPPR